MKDSIAKQPTVESSSCSPVAAPKKRKRQSGNAEIENFAMDFPFYCIFFFKFAYCCYIFICLSSYNVKRMKNEELKWGAITNPTPVYLEQLSPIPALAAED